jgi:hypothetical protein
MRNRLAGVCALMLILAVPMGCSMHGGRAEEPKSVAPNSTFVYLVSGPNSGKGSPEWWVANVKPGRVMFELSYPNEKTALEALQRAMHKLPMKCRIVRREESVED